ncbi:MAG: hypothetical protein SH856_13830 [Flavobacteriales bacterium]|nr:hypothetical protein [Flavobacteriales bacterium]
MKAEEASVSVGFTWVFGLLLKVLHAASHRVTASLGFSQFKRPMASMVVPFRICKNEEDDHKVQLCLAKAHLENANCNQCNGTQLKNRSGSGRG